MSIIPMGDQNSVTDLQLENAALRREVLDLKRKLLAITKDDIFKPIEQVGVATPTVGTTPAPG